MNSPRLRLTFIVLTMQRTTRKKVILRGMRKSVWNQNEEHDVLTLRSIDVLRVALSRNHDALRTDEVKSG